PITVSKRYRCRLLLDSATTLDATNLDPIPLNSTTD
ncbi:uncharacterized protein METZ01_LOCUS223319, partial [marine metagenome]